MKIIIYGINGGNIVRGTPLEYAIYYSVMLLYLILLASPLIFWLTRHQFRKKILQNKKNLSFKFLYKYGMHERYGVAKKADGSLGRYEKMDTVLVIFFYFVAIGFFIVVVVLPPVDMTHELFIRDIWTLASNDILLACILLIAIIGQKFDNKKLLEELHKDSDKKAQK